MIRNLLFAAYMALSVVAVALFHLPLALISPRGAAAAAAAWSRAGVWMAKHLAGISVEVRGREHIPAGPALVACKHQSMLDTLMPFVVLHDPKIVLKQELAVAPIFGWYAKRAGMIALDRDGHAGALRNLLKAARASVAQGHALVIFPEGTRQAPHAPPAYKPGVAALYRDLKLPCVPVALNTGCYWPARGLGLKRGMAVIEFLPAIAPGLSREDFMAELAARIDTASAALVQEAESALRA